MKAHSLWNAILYTCLVSLILDSCNNSGGAGSVSPVADTVYISGMKFNPAEIWINKWDTVVWINNDIVNHDVTAFPGKAWTSDTIVPGRSWKMTMGDSASYFCSIHPTMKGKVMVRQ